MSLVRKVAHNTLIQFVGKAIGMVLALVTVGLMLRYLGQTGFGQYATIIAYLSIFAIMADLGLYLVVTREIARKRVDQDKIVSNALTIKFFAGLIVLSIASVVVWFFPYDDLVKYGVLVGAFSFLFVLLNQTLIGVFQKYFAMYKVAIAEVAGRFVWLGVVILVIHFQASLLYMILGIAFSNFVNFLIVFLFSRKYVRVRPDFDFTEWKSIMRVAAPLAFSVVFNLIYFKIDTLFLSLMKPEQDVGIYGAPYKVLEALITFAAIFAGLLLPVMSKYFAENKKKFANIYKKGFDILVICVVPLIVGTLFLANPIMSFFGGEQFVESGTVLKILIFATGGIFFSHLFGNAAVACNQQKKLMWVYILTAGLAIALNLFLIPKFSYYGAAISTVASEVCVTLLTALVVWRVVGVGLSFKIFGKVLIATGAMALVLWGISDWNFFIQIIIAVLCYFAAAFLIKAISMETVIAVVKFKKES